MDSALQRLTEHVRAAAASGTPLRIRGGGSKDFYGQSLQGDLLETTALTGITSYEPSELVVTARAGTPLLELEAALADQGQCLPFEPPYFSLRSDTQDSDTHDSGAQDSGGSVSSVASVASVASVVSLATVGGMVAAGLSGPARASVGGVRDYMLGVQLLNGRAEHLTFGGQVMKNVAGYDVSRLMAGSMGTLGIITDVSLKVLPVAPAEATLVFEMDQAEALAQLHRWGGQPLPLNASCWVGDDDAATPDATGMGRLYLRLRGAIAAVESASKSMAQQAAGKRLDNAVAAPDWQACRDLRLPFFTTPPQPDMALWRLSVAQTAPPLDLPWPQLMEWHGALRWLWAPPAAAASVRQAAVAANGRATIFIANYLYRAWANGKYDVFPELQGPLGGIHHRLKAEFDPQGIFNRGRLYPQLDSKA